MRKLLRALLLVMLLPGHLLAQPEVDAALCQAQDRLETLRLALEPLDKTVQSPVPPIPSVTDAASLAAVLKAMAETNLLIRDALYEVVDAPWPDEVKRAYVEYFLSPAGAPGLAQRVGAENLARLRSLLETPLLKDAGWPTPSALGDLAPAADFQAFLLVAQGRGADPQWVAQTLLPRLKKLAAAGEIQPLGPAWLAAGGHPDLGRFAREFTQAGPPWSRYGAQLEGLARLQGLMPSLGAAARLPALSPAACGAEKRGKPGTK